MKQRFSEEQIIGILKQQEGGTATVEICRQHGISAATFYKWKSKYGGLNVSEAQRLRQLELENAKLKRIVADQAVADQAVADQAVADQAVADQAVADQALDIVAFKDINSKNW